MMPNGAGSDGNFMLWDLGTGQCCRYLPISTTVVCLAVDAPAESGGDTNSQNRRVQAYWDSTQVKEAKGHRRTMNGSEVERVYT